MNNIVLHPARRTDLFQKGQASFNDEKFFEAHEHWEELWKLEGEPDKKFVQALIQAAGHFVHLQKQNASGALTLAKTALEKLYVVPAQKAYQGCDVTPIVAALHYNVSVLEETSETEMPSFDKFLCPKLF